jgi:dipeptidyl aminopeptidase/acylaminoacyl peptidase
MRSPNRRGWPLLLALWLAPASHGTPLEVYGRLPHIEDISLSPDGRRVAFVRDQGEERFVAIVALETGALIGKLRVGEAKVRGLGWADDLHVIIETSVTSFAQSDFTKGVLFAGRGEVFQVQVYDLRVEKAFMIPQPGAQNVLVNYINGPVSVRHVKERSVLYVRGVLVGIENKRVLLGVDAETHVARVVASAKPNTMLWAVDGEGEVAAEETYDRTNGRWSILIPKGGHMQEVASGESLIEVPIVRGPGPTADTLLVSSIEDNELVWRLLSPNDGRLGEPMAAEKALQWPIEDPITHRMVGGSYLAGSDDSVRSVFIDPHLERSWQAIVRAFPNERVHLESASSDFGKMLVRVEGERDGYCFELVDLATHRAEPLGDIYEGIKPLEVRRIDYPATDGLSIPAYLTLPRGRPAHKLPLIVLPHGTPSGRDTADFDWWSQALADQGYLVLRPNFRGSGLDRAFFARGFGELGRKMQTDLSDGVRYLVAQGLADPARVCIVGRGYGGYAAVAGVSLEPDVYRCAVNVAGYSDLKRMLTGVNQQRFSQGANVAERYWDRFLGVSGPNDPALDAISPVKHVDAIKVPVLLIHGKDDLVVPYAQSQEMYDALRSAHKDVELVQLKDEDHWLSRSATRLQMLETSVAFLRAHNPPEP